MNFEGICFLHFNFKRNFLGHPHEGFFLGYIHNFWPLNETNKWLWKTFLFFSASFLFMIDLFFWAVCDRLSWTPKLYFASFLLQNI